MTIFSRIAGGRRKRYISSALSDAGAPEAPRETIDTTYSLPTGGTTWTPVDATEFQAALDGAEPGDVIVLDKDTTYSGAFKFTAKATSEDWIYVISSALASLPEGQRVSLSDAVYMPTVSLTNNTSQRFALAVFEEAVSRYRFARINFTTNQATLGE